MIGEFSFPLPRDHGVLINAKLHFPDQFGVIRVFFNLLSVKITKKAGLGMDLKKNASETWS